MAEKGWKPIHDTSASDIFVCSYPRSGVTWFQNLIAGVVHGVDPAPLDRCCRIKILRSLCIVLVF